MRILRLRIVLAVLGLAWMAPAGDAGADTVAPPPVRLRVSVDRKKETERRSATQPGRRSAGEQRKSRARPTQHISEQIRARLDVQNLTAHALRDLQAEIVFLADARPDWGKAVHVQQGRQTLRIAEIPALGRAKVESEAVEFATKRTFGSGPQSKGRETGREYAGIAVRLSREGRVVAESFSPTSKARTFRDLLSWQTPGRNVAGP